MPPARLTSQGSAAATGAKRRSTSAAAASLAGPVWTGLLGVVKDASVLVTILLDTNGPERWSRLYGTFELKQSYAIFQAPPARR